MTRKIYLEITMQQMSTGFKARHPGSCSFDDWAYPWMLLHMKNFGVNGSLADADRAIETSST
jgi:hypothetical protein